MNSLPHQFKDLIMSNRKKLETDRNMVVVFDHATKLARIERKIDSERKEFLQSINCNNMYIENYLVTWEVHNLKLSYMLIMVPITVYSYCVLTLYVEYYIDYSKHRWVIDAYPRGIGFSNDRIYSIEILMCELIHGDLAKLADPKIRKLIMNEGTKIVKKSHMDILKSSKYMCYYCAKVTNSSHTHFKRCGTCNMIHYCSKECQQKDWKYTHRIKCKIYRSNWIRFKQMIELIMDVTLDKYNQINTPKKVQSTSNKINPPAVIEHFDDLD